MEYRIKGGSTRKVWGKGLIAGIFLLSWGILPLFAEPDNGKLLPDKEKFKVENLYVAVDPVRLQFPVSFSGLGSLSSVTQLGYGFAGELGYNWSGWLLGLHTGFSTYGQGSGRYALMENFNNLSSGLHLSRVLSSRTLEFLPPWLELVPSVGVGLQLIKTDYYPSLRARDEGRIRHLDYGDDMAAYYYFALNAAFDLGTDLAIPYVGLDYNVFVDEIGVVGYPSIGIGVRSYPGSFFTKKNRQETSAANETPVSDQQPEEKIEPVILEPLGPPALALDVAPNDFTPDGDGFHDEAVFLFGHENFTAKDVAEWKFTIYGPKGKVFKSFSGTDDMPSVLTWDGLGDDVNDHVLSTSTYKAVLETVFKDGTSLQTESEIETGLQLEKNEDGSLRIRVTSIFFDPSAASFDRITEEQKETNLRTFDILVRLINKYPQYNVRIEGHANNTSGTEKENIEDLIPLSQERAERIQAELHERGVALNRMTAVGKGGSEPIVPREDREQWWQNRRVEFFLIKQD